MTENPPVEKPAELTTSASVAKSLFLGAILEENLFPFPEFESSEKETLGLIIESVDKFMEGREEEFRRFDDEAKQPDEYVNSLKELGLFGLIIPEEYGGIGLSAKGYSRTLQQTSRFDGSTSLTVGAHSSIGMRGLLLFGSEDQKGRYLEKLASGEMIAAFCLTESGSGSDAASIKTSAVKQDDGSWVLSGEKIWITNGPIADFFTVFARTESDSGKLSAFIVERSYSGVSTGPKEDKLGIRSSGTCTVSFQDVKVPAENLLGAEGKGFKVAMAILNSGRSGLGGGCVGGMKISIKRAAQHARDRKQFGRSISEFGLVKEKLAQMTVDCFAAESAVMMIAHYSDSDVEDYSVEAAITKIFCTEALWRCSYEALQISGGNGYMKEYPYERLMRDARINMIFEGTNEILRLFIALSGMKEAGRYLKEIGSGVENIFNDPIKGFGVLSGFAAKKFTQLTSLGRDKIESAHPALSEEVAVVEQYTLEFSKAVEAVLRKHGKNIIGKQFASKRIAEVAVDLFVSLSVISRVSALIGQKGEGGTAEERKICRVFLQQAKRRMNQNLRRIDKNEDELLKHLADYIVENEGYPWDTL